MRAQKPSTSFVYSCIPLKPPLANVNKLIALVASEE
jgi:hypothetical protein